MKDLNLNAHVIEQLLLTAKDYLMDFGTQSSRVAKEAETNKKWSELVMLQCSIMRDIEKIDVLIDLAIDNAVAINQSKDEQ